MSAEKGLLALCARFLQLAAHTATGSRAFPVNFRAMSPQNRLAGRTREELLSHKKSLTVPRRARSSACTYISLCARMYGKGCVTRFGLSICSGHLPLSLGRLSSRKPALARLLTPPQKQGLGKQHVQTCFYVSVSARPGRRLWRLAGSGTGKNCEGNAVERSLRPPAMGYEKKLATGGLRQIGAVYSGVPGQ